MKNHPLNQENKRLNQLILALETQLTEQKAVLEDNKKTQTIITALFA